MTEIARRLLVWYRQNKRILPWRDSTNPYAVWVSEIMLQQTRVETVIPYFERWMEKFPSAESLAASDEQGILNLWEGLGYYSRARNLHLATQIVVAEYGGKLPADAATLQKLPGIGRYTAAAIASMAFGLDEAALDGNIRRVYARIFNIEEPLGTAKTEKIFWRLAEENLPTGEAGDYNQALMDLGATLCSPRSPKCEDCPINGSCQAYQLGVQETLPVRKAKRAVPHYVHAAGVIVEAGRVLLAKRPSQGLLAGMWEFPNGRVDGDPAEGLADVIWRAHKLKVHAVNPLVEIHHAYTHFKITEYAFRCERVHVSPNKKMRWVNIAELEDYPMGKVDRQIARRLVKDE